MQCSPWRRLRRCFIPRGRRCLFVCRRHSSSVKVRMTSRLRLGFRPKDMSGLIEGQGRQTSSQSGLVTGRWS